MPTYQYSCTECGHFFEIFQSFSEDSLSVCPECEGKLRKVYNAVGVVFKGSGFYRTDSRNASSGGVGVSSSPGESNGSSSSSDNSGSASGSDGAKTGSANGSGSTSGSGSGSGSGSRTGSKPVDKASSRA